MAFATWGGKRRGDRQGRLRGAFLDAIPALFSTTSGQQ